MQEEHKGTGVIPVVMYQLELFERVVPYVQIRLVEDAKPRYLPRIQVTTPADVAAFVMGYFRDRATEEFLILNLSTANVVINVTLISRGGLAASIVEPRAVFQGAILSNAAGIICVHNHPSGQRQASRQDIQITKQLVEAGCILGIPVHDHIIIAHDHYTSLAEQGCIG